MVVKKLHCTRGRFYKNGFMAEKLSLHHKFNATVATAN